jgi:uncharacterized protein (TIGR03437 family)
MLILTLLMALVVSAPAQQTCTFTLSPTSRSVPATPDTIGSITVQASSSSCTRTAISDSPDWLTISFGSTGTGNGSIGYRVDTSDVPEIRSGRITVGNARFTVTQAAAACTLDISPVSARVTPQAGGGSIRVTTRCRWTASSSVPWLTTTSAGSGDGSVTYSYEANASTSPRNGVITIGTRTFAISQDGIPCTTRLALSSADHSGDGGSGTFGVASTCTWRAAPSQAWIALTGAATGTGNGIIGYTVAASTLPAPRLGAITVGDQTFVIRQAESALPRITAIRNLASMDANVAAPGTLLAILGTRLGPAGGAAAESPETTEVAGTRVLVDGVPAAVLYASSELVSAVVPIDAESARTARVVVEFQGRESLSFGLPLSSTAPGIFTSDGSGIGVATVLNADLSVNNPSNPASKRSLVTLFVTGAGSQAASPAAWTLSIGGARAEVIYAGVVPGLPPGIVQINALIPPAAPAGEEVPVFVVVGGAISQQGVTLSIQ